MNVRRLYGIVRLRLRSLFGRSRVESELDRELSFHFHRQVEENLASGMSPEDARRAAERSLDGLSRTREECRDMRRVHQFEATWNDLRYAVRTLARAPSFTFIIVLTLALSIGANSAIFSVIEGVLLRPLPFPQPGRLVRIYFNSDTQPKFPLNPNDFLDFRARNRTFESMAVLTRRDAQLSGLGEPVMLRAFSVSADYFHTLGFHPARGRDFSPPDGLPGRGRVVILSDRLWRTRFAADPAILGRTLTLDAQPFTVIGIMPAGARHPGNNFHAVSDGETVDLWRPYTFDDDPTNRASHFMDGIGRLKPDVSAAQANADLSAVLSQLKNEHTGDGWRVVLIPLYREMVGQSERMLLVLLGAVSLLLLIACVNAANLLLARSGARVREVAVRSALGAGRSRIVRQLLTESLVIAGCAAALGTLLAMGGVRLLVASLPQGFPRASEIRLDTTVFAFTLAVAVLTGILFGLVPALTASRVDLQQSLREGGRSATGGMRQLRLRNLLVVGEIALASVLLIAAGLMLHSFVNLLRADPGFQPRKVLTASLALPVEHYRGDAPRLRFYDQLIRKLEALPGVQAAAVATDLPWTGYDGNADGFTVEGRPAGYNSQTTARYHVASPDYFRALGIPLLRGRFLTSRDNSGAPAVILVNEAMANRYWPGQDAVGKRISFRGRPEEKDWIQVAGVVGDIRDRPDSNAVRPAFWRPFAQEPQGVVSVVVRFSSDPRRIADQFRQTLRELDGGLAVDELRFMNDIASSALSVQRFALFLVGLFAALALVLATCGMFGVISYSVNQRMREFGMRMALGARPRDLLRLILGQGMVLSVLGAGLGLVGAAGLTRLMGSLLYGVGGADPAAFAGVAVLALTTTALACYIPARRAAGADPMRSLRAE